MPEYLSPGVYIEEVPARIKAIEGVSTSTAGFVGAARRGPVAGLALPYVPDPGWTVEPDPTPVLVTSYAEYVRRFGTPPDDPTERDEYLGYAVQAFFGNGGKRCFIARVVNEDTGSGDEAARGRVRVGQGPVARLTRTARVDATQVFLNSLRGISVGTHLTFLRAADGTNMLTSPAVVTGTASAPFALAVGDQVGVSVNGAAAANMAAVAATAAEVDITAAAAAVDVSAAVPFTVELRAGSAAEPVQRITFDAADFADPTAATLAEFAAVFSSTVTGLQVITDVPTLTITLRTDVAGTGAFLQVVTAPAAATGLTASPVTAGGGNVADLAHVTTNEVIALFGGPVGFSIAATAAGQLQFTSTASGSTENIQIVDTVVGTAAKLGLPTALAAGSGTADAVVQSYDTMTNMVTLTAPLTVELLPAEVYAELDSVTWSASGPMFHARDPGAWAEDMQVLVQPSDRPAVPVSTAVAAGQTDIPVQSTSSFYRGAIVEIDHGGSRSYYALSEIRPGNTLRLSAGLTAPITTGFARVVEMDVIVAEPDAGLTEVYRGLSWNPDSRPEVRRRHYATVLNARSRLVFVQPPGTGTPAPAPAGAEAADLASMPMTENAFAAKPLSADSGDDGETPRVDDYVGRDNGPGARSGIQALLESDDIRLVAAPGHTDAEVQNELITQCELLRYRFALLDGERDPSGSSVVNAVLGHRGIYDTSFAAYYSPWVEIGSGEDLVVLPPSGYIAGICARTDNSRGVHKAPANEVVRNITGLYAYYSTGEQDLLNPRGVNAIRKFEGRGLRVWGARTLSSDAEFRYVNVRRTMIFLSASIDRGTQWVVFEPNSPPTWSRVVDSVSAFLHTQWRSGALFGRRPEDSFYVRCDESTMSEDDVLNGRLVCEIGVAIVRPAEFVIFRIEQLSGFAT